MGFIKESRSNNRAGLIVAFRGQVNTKNYVNTDSIEEAINYNAEEMLSVINYAKKIYFERPADWDKMVVRGMKQDFSWNSSARQYEGLYSWMINW